MKALEYKSFRFCLASLAFTLLFLFGTAHGGISEVKVLPGLPIIETDLWTNHSVNPSYLLGDYEISGNKIVVDLYFLDYIKPDRFYLGVCGSWKSTLDLGFLAQGDYQFETRLWTTKNHGILDIPLEQLNIEDLSDFDFSLWESYDMSFTLDQDYSSPFEPGLTYEDNLFMFIIGEALPVAPIDNDWLIFPLPTDLKSALIEGYGYNNLNSSTAAVPEPASILLFASAAWLLYRRRK